MSSSNFEIINRCIYTTQELGLVIIIHQRASRNSLDTSEAASLEVISFLNRFLQFFLMGCQDSSHFYLSVACSMAIHELA